MLVKNIKYSVLFKVIGMGLTLLMVPMLLNVLGVAGYGVWAALTSLIVWITLFDFGMGHALKNTVSKSVAIGLPQNAHHEFFQVLKISTISVLVILFIFFIALYYVDLLNKNPYVTMIIFLPLILLFPLKTANFVLQGARLIALESGLLFINTLLFFLFIGVLYLLDFEISLITIATGFVVSYLISIVLISNKALALLELSLKDLSKVRDVKFDFDRVQVGFKFFGLQVSSLVLYSLGTVLVFSYLSSESAAQFDVVSKIFVFGLSFFTIAIGAFWPEITTHLSKKEFIKIYKLYVKMLLLSLLFSLFAFVVAYYSPQIIQLWTGSQIQVKKEEAYFFALLVSFQAIAYSGAVVLNAFERINIQLTLSIFATVFMVPLTVYLFDIGYGIEAVPFASAILTFLAMVYCNSHAYILIRRGLS